MSAEESAISNALFCQQTGTRSSRPRPIPSNRRSSSSLMPGRVTRALEIRNRCTGLNPPSLRRPVSGGMLRRFRHPRRTYTLEEQLGHLSNNASSALAGTPCLMRMTVRQRVELHEAVHIVLIPNTRVSSDELVHENHIRVGKSPSQDRVTDYLTVRLLSIERSKRFDLFVLGLPHCDVQTRARWPQ